MDYEKIIKEGERTDWYGEQVPRDLITNSVIAWCEPLLHEIDVLESELNDFKGVQNDKKRGTINLLLNNVRKAPYSLNGDFYLKKKKKYESEIEKEKIQKNKKSNNKKTEKTDKNKKVTSTKNSHLIFGKNK